MPGATTKLALPYPVPADTVDVPRDVKALADKLDTYPNIARPPLVTVLPSAPVDGDECYFVADNAKGIIWHLRYGAAAPTYKWHFVGGPSLATSAPAVEQTNATAQPGVDLTTALFRVLPLAGLYSLRLSAANVWNNAAGATLVTANLLINGSVALASTNNVPGQNLVTSQLTEYADLDITTPNADVRAKYMVAAGTGFWQTRTLIVTPQRVG